MRIADNGTEVPRIRTTLTTDPSSDYQLDTLQNRTGGSNLEEVVGKQHENPHGDI